MESKVTKKQTKSVAPATPVVAAAPVAAAPAKKSTKAVESTPVAAPAAAPVAAEAPAKKSTKKTAAASEVASVAPSAATTESTTVATEATEVDVHGRLETLANDMIKMAKQFLEASRQARKEHARVVKKAEQGGKRRHRKADGESTHSNSVFLQPCKVSPALASFCGIEAGAMISRTDATRTIGAYIKKHNLQNPENRREIRADATLTKLFSLGAEDKLNYFNLQRYISPHFVKEPKAQ